MLSNIKCVWWQDADFLNVCAFFFEHSLDIILKNENRAVAPSPSSGRVRSSTKVKEQGRKAASTLYFWVLGLVGIFTNTIYLQVIQNGKI